jgi:membrane associated rhomboid family serine protease
MRRSIIVGPDTRFLRLGGRPARATAILLGVQLGFFLLYVFADGPRWVLSYLGAGALQTFGELRLWQPLTALFVHIEPRGLILDLLTLWVFGSALERWWGRRRFVWFYLATGVTGLLLGLFFALVSVSRATLVGSSGSAIALLVATAVIFPQHLAQFQSMTLGVKVRLLCLLMGGFALLGTLMLSAWLDSAVELGGGLCALLFVYPPRQLIARWRLRRAKRKLKVVQGGSSGSGGYVN